jgi:hypothetical protein
VDALTGDREVFGSEDPERLAPLSELAASEAKSEVGETERGVKPNSLK